MDGTRTGTNTFFGIMEMAWLEDKVATTFHTDTPYYGSSAVDIIKSLRLDVLNDFLIERGFRLQSSNSLDIPSTPTGEDRKEDMREEEENPFEAFLEELTEGGVEAIQKSMRKLEKLIIDRFNKIKDT